MGLSFWSWVGVRWKVVGAAGPGSRGWAGEESAVDEEVGAGGAGEGEERDLSARSYMVFPLSNGRGRAPIAGG